MDDSSSGYSNSDVEDTNHYSQTLSEMNNANEEIPTTLEDIQKLNGSTDDLIFVAGDYIQTEVETPYSKIECHETEFITTNLKCGNTNSMNEPTSTTKIDINDDSNEFQFDSTISSSQSMVKKETNQETDIFNEFNIDAKKIDDSSHQNIKNRPYENGSFTKFKFNERNTNATDQIIDLKCKTSIDTNNESKNELIFNKHTSIRTYQRRKKAIVTKPLLSLESSSLQDESITVGGNNISETENELNSETEQNVVPKRGRPRKNGNKLKKSIENTVNKMPLHSNDDDIIAKMGKSIVSIEPTNAHKSNFIENTGEVNMINCIEKHDLSEIQFDSHMYNQTISTVDITDGGMANSNPVSSSNVIISEIEYMDVDETKNVAHANGKLNDFFLISFLLFILTLFI